MSEGADAPPANPANATNRSPRHARMGPAPFASFEDLSDEVRSKGDSPDEKPIIRLPNIKEDETVVSAGPPTVGGQANQSQGPQGPYQATSAMENLGPNVSISQGSGNLQTPSTPRIDISRASSSSHHDSRDSSPENAIFGISDSNHDPEGAKLGLGFREDGTADLRSSTEELAFLEPNTVTTEKETPKQSSRKSPLMFKQEDHHRKDSQCSDIVLLSISGRTSRLSSIGSQGSGHSNISAHSNMSHISVHSNVSHISGQSRLSVISGISRSPSPHKMLLETSFCGPKPLENDVGVVGNDKQLEQVLLSRKHDPKEAILAEGISLNKKEVLKQTQNNKVSTVEQTSSAPITESKENIKKQPEVIRKESITSPVITVSTLGVSYKSDKKSSSQISKSEPVARSKQVISSTKKAPQKFLKTSDSSEPEYIRIKLKPDHMYNDENEQSSQQESLQKPVSLNLNDHSKKSAQHFSQLVKHEDNLNKNSQCSEEKNDTQKTLTNVEKLHSQVHADSPKQTKIGKDHGSRTPSPAAKTPSRKSSFCSLFKSKETIASPESPTGVGSKRKGVNIIKDNNSTHSSRSRSKSRERDKSGLATPTSGGKSKGSVLAIFRPSRKSSASASPVARESLPNLEIHTVESKYTSEIRSTQNLRQPPKERLKYYDTPVDGFIRIPLHTPPDEEKPVVKEKIQIKTMPKEDSGLYCIKTDIRPVSAPSSSRPSFSSTAINLMEKSKKSDSGYKQTVLPDGSIRIPLHSPSEDRLVRCDLMSEQEIEELNRFCSNISTKKDSSLKSTSDNTSSSTDISKNDNSEKNLESINYSECEHSVEIEKHPEPKSSVSIMPVEALISQNIVDQVEVDIETKPEEEKLSSQAKKHIIFATKIGSKEHLFSTQFSLSKTDSQSSQMSENRSQISEESVIEVQLGEKHTDDLNNVECTPLSENKCEFTDSNLGNTKIDTVEKDSNNLNKNQSNFKEIESQRNNNIIIKKEDSFTEPRKIILPETCIRNSVLSIEDVVHDSSGSERDSELDFIKQKQNLVLDKTGRTDSGEIDYERKGLVMQQDSFDDELPYIPTTLPQERSVALPIVPIKQRQGIEVKTCPIERPRSTTPINPSCLEEYCSDEVYTPDGTKVEKLKISLPKDTIKNNEETSDKQKRQKAKSPRRISAASSPKTWFEFAEQGIANTGTRKSSTGHESDSEPAPPLPPRAPVSKSQWINFENIPERRKVPKRIQTLPTRSNVEVASEANVIYTYVNPEDCKCECHESGRETVGDDITPEKEDDEEPLLDENTEMEGISAPPTENAVKKKIAGPKEKRDNVSAFSHGQRPTSGTKGRSSAFNSNTSSNRSSVTSQDADRSSSSGSPNDVAFPLRRSTRSP